MDNRFFQRRFDKLSAIQNRNPYQQKMLDQVSAKLNPAPSITGNTALDINPAPTPADVGMKPPFVGSPTGVTGGVGPTSTSTPADVGMKPPFVGSPTGVQDFQSTVNGAPPPNYGSMTFKRGGKVKSKTKAASKSEPKESVKGWGIARGARKAKIY